MGVLLVDTGFIMGIPISSYVVNRCMCICLCVYAFVCMAMQCNAMQCTYVQCNVHMYIYIYILWMEEILHQLVYGLSHCSPIIYSLLYRYIYICINVQMYSLVHIYLLQGPHRSLGATISTWQRLEAAGSSR